MNLSAELKHSGGFRLDNQMRLGAPTLTVRDLEATVSFYQRDMGFSVKSKGAGRDGLQEVELGFKKTSEPILRLRHNPKASAAPQDFAGLYHYAVLLPHRKDLASTFLSVGNSGVPYEGFADHTFSEALYLHDVEENGIELYADRPKAAWPDWGRMMQGGNDGFAAMNGPLDFDSLLRELNPAQRSKPEPFPNGARIGHMHLRVTNLENSVRFYHEQLGLDLNAYIPEIGVAFLSVGGYHHHLGLNTWHSKGGSPHRDGEAGLDEFRMVLPSVRALEDLSSRLPQSTVRGGKLTLSDPDGIRIEITS
jgi:catechol 2,3-dioxygenase